VRGQASDWMSVISGVPQGSVLGPLLFLLYVNVIPNIIKCNIKMFADDTKLWRMIVKKADSCDLQDDLKRLQEWNKKCMATQVQLRQVHRDACWAQSSYTVRHGAGRPDMELDCSN